MVRAKFMVTEIHQLHWGGTRVVLTPQYDQTIEEDRRFCSATPSGRFEMQIDNPAAIAQFPLGSTHYADFSPVPTAS